MRRTTVVGAWLLAAWTLSAPAPLVAQGPTGEPSDPVVPLPLWHSHPESGGFFAAGQFLFYRQTNPIGNQNVAFRGFVPLDDRIAGADAIGKLIGSGAVALNVSQVSGPNSYQPGFSIEAGWRFGDGSTVTLGYARLTEAKYSAVATLFPPGFNVGRNFENTFLTSPVSNFPNDFAGPEDDVRRSDGSLALGATSGIWNAADQMTISFVQRYQDVFITYRVPIYENECYRVNGLVGPRMTWIWERFKWLTVDLHGDGTAGPTDQATYSNTLSNYMYGAFVGCQQEYYLGHGFVAMVDARASGYVDFVHEIVRFERGDKQVANKRAKHEYDLVPQLQGSLGLMWYPIEGVQLQLGYDVMVFFNTVTSKQPVTFDYSGLDPQFDHSVIRFFDGFHAGISFTF